MAYFMTITDHLDKEHSNIVALASSLYKCGTGNCDKCDWYNYHYSRCEKVWRDASSLILYMAREIHELGGDLQWLDLSEEKTTTGR